jgi:RsiW-degrading membrane proteinase PrsW (M82 family)
MASNEVAKLDEQKVAKDSQLQDLQQPVSCLRRLAYNAAMFVILLAFAPAMALLIFYYLRDRHPEPWLWVLLVFFLGALSCAVAFPLQRLVQAVLPAPTDVSGWLLLECLLVPGLIEESVKLGVVLGSVFWRRDFDDPIDGLVYATAAALGFTYGEDLVHYLAHGPDWRRVLSVVAHPWFSCFWGAALGWSRTLPWKQGVGLVGLGLLASISVHAVFDFFVLAADMDSEWAWLRYCLTPLVIGLFFAMEWHFERLQPTKAKEQE